MTKVGLWLYIKNMELWFPNTPRCNKRFSRPVTGGHVCMYSHWPAYLIMLTRPQNELLTIIFVLLNLSAVSFFLKRFVSNVVSTLFHTQLGKNKWIGIFLNWWKLKYSNHKKRFHHSLCQQYHIHLVPLSSNSIICCYYYYNAGRPLQGEGFTSLIWAVDPINCHQGQVVTSNPWAETFGLHTWAESTTFPQLLLHAQVHKCHDWVLNPHSAADNTRVRCTCSWWTGPLGYDMSLEMGKTDWDY